MTKSHVRTIQISGIGLSQIQRSPCDGFEMFRTSGFDRVVIRYSMANFVGDSSLFQPSGGGVLGMPQARWRYSGIGGDIISITAESCGFSLVTIQ